LEHVAPTTARSPVGLLLAALVAGAAVVLVYAVGFDPTVHELMHDGRHLLGLPCH
jgi:cobalt transporter subunit CbtB